MKKNFFFLFIIAHLTFVVLVSLDTSIATYLEYNNELILQKTSTKEHYKSNDFLKFLPHNSLVNYYLVLTGTDSGYGFFSPNVASSYVIEHTQINKFNTETKTTYFPNLKTYEGLVRYNAMVNSFQLRMKVLKTHRENLYGRCLDVLLKSVGQGLCKTNQQSTTVKCITTLNLYYTPSLLETGLNHTKPKLFKIVSINSQHKE